MCPSPPSPPRPPRNVEAPSQVSPSPAAAWDKGQVAGTSPSSTPVPCAASPCVLQILGQTSTVFMVLAVYRVRVLKAFVLKEAGRLQLSTAKVSQKLQGPKERNNSNYAGAENHSGTA